MCFLAASDIGPLIAASTAPIMVDESRLWDPCECCADSDVTAADVLSISAAIVREFFMLQPPTSSLQPCS